MVDPLSGLAIAVVTLILPKALGKVGEKLGEAVFTKSGETIQAIRKAVQEKLQATKTEGVLALAEAEPTQANAQMLQSLLLNQIKTDQSFADYLQKLVNQAEAQSPRPVQEILNKLRTKGSVDISDIDQQINSEISGSQSVGTDWEVDGNVKISKVNQKQGFSERI